MQRYDVFLTPTVEAALPAGASEVTLWRPGAGGAGAKPKAHPLSLYSVQSILPIRLGKGMVLPERIAAYEVQQQPCWPTSFSDFAHASHNPNPSTRPRRCTVRYHPCQPPGGCLVTVIMGI